MSAPPITLPNGVSQEEAWLPRREAIIMCRKLNTHEEEEEETVKPCSNERGSAGFCSQYKTVNDLWSQREDFDVRFHGGFSNCSQ